MAQYKLVYFNVKGRAEFIRFIFAQADVEYKDERIKKEDWPSLKPKTPFGMLPVLEVDGKLLGGSQVIARYVAEKHGLAGANNFETAVLASVVDAVCDLMSKVSQFIHEKDEMRKTEQKQELEEKFIPDTLGHLEKFVAENKEGWLIGSKPTYGDLGVYTALEQLREIFTSVSLDKFPRVSQLMQKVESLPKIAKWLKERPATPK